DGLPADRRAGPLRRLPRLRADGPGQRHRGRRDHRVRAQPAAERGAGPGGRPRRPRRGGARAGRGVREGRGARAGGHREERRRGGAAMTETAVDLLITDVCVWTAGEWREHRDVAVAGGRVVAIRPAGAERAAAPHTVDGSGGHLLPGIVNTHTHLNQALLRGIGEGLPLLAWLRGVGEATVALTPEQAYTAAACAAVEALRSGTTTLVE